VLRGRDVDEVIELKRRGLSVRAISRLTGYDRKTVRRYLCGAGKPPGIWAASAGGMHVGAFQGVFEGAAQCLRKLLGCEKLLSAARRQWYLRRQLCFAQ
jgi:hypothetical protein